MTVTEMVEILRIAWSADIELLKSCFISDCKNPVVAYVSYLELVGNFADLRKVENNVCKDHLEQLSKVMATYLESLDND